MLKRSGRLVKTEYIISGMPDVRIAVLPDFHNGEAGPVLEILRDDPPDIVTVPGDFIVGVPPADGSLVMRRCTGSEELLRGCAELAPTYVSLGNHEYFLCTEDIDIIRSTGAVLLDNTWAEACISRCEQRIFIGGLSAHKCVRYGGYREFCRERALPGDLERYPERMREREVYMSFSSRAAEWLDGFEQLEGYTVLMCHHPEYWYRKDPWLFRRRVDLVVSGHAHGGQIRIGGQGLYAPGQGVLPLMTDGIHEGPHGRLLISRGISNSYWPVPRFGNPCEVVYLEGAK